MGKQAKKLKFKVGDKVRILNDYGSEWGKGTIGIITNVQVIDVDDDENYSVKFNHETWWFREKDLQLASEKPPKVNFLLQYELDEDPIEEFETMAQVEDRIKELFEDESELQRDSIKVYEVKAVHAVEINITIK